MMGLCYQTSIWLDRLWAEHLHASKPARDLVQAGIHKQGDRFAGFPADLHARLYLPNDPHAIDTSPDWASRLHDLASELSEWQRLRLMCSRNGFAAGIATEVMLDQLLPHVPDRPPEPPASPRPQPDSQPDAEHSPPSDPSSPGASPPEPRPSTNQPGPSDAQLRAAVRRATRAARDAVQEAESQLDGLTTPLGFSMPGTSVARDTGPANLKAIRDAHSRLGTSHRLRRITELAGRLERAAISKARSKVRPGVGEIHGIGLGSDLARLLPSELVSLRHPLLRLALLARLLQGRALTYAMTGREPQQRGPIVVLLDESSSMREGIKDIWSKAVCLALLATATRQKRAWHLIAFNGDIVREVAIPASKATAADIQQALDHGCSGGTDFNAPVRRAIEIIHTSPTMKQADVVIITDGEDSLEPATSEAASALTRTEGVSWFAVGVGPDAEVGLQSLAPIATTMVRIKSTDDPEPIIPVINLAEK